MQKNWYLVYTKPKSEKKVAATLTKRKIENFCPHYRTQVEQIRKSKIIDQPLFNSYVFVFVEEEKISYIRNIENVLSLVYWKGQPAIIQGDEILIIKDFINDYQDIRLEKTYVNDNESAKIIDRPAFTIDGNLLTLKNKSIKVNLPSIGYTLIADIRRNEELLGRQLMFNKELSLQ